MPPPSLVPRKEVGEILILLFPGVTTVCRSLKAHNLLTSFALLDQYFGRITVVQIKTYCHTYASIMSYQIEHVLQQKRVEPE